MNQQTTTTDPRIKIEFVEQPGGLRMVLSGLLDADAAPLLSRQFEELFARGQTSFLIDLAGITMISSAGIGCLIAGVGEARDEGGSVHVDSMSSTVRHILGMLDLLDFLTG